MKTYTLEEAEKMTLPSLFAAAEGEDTVLVKDGEREFVVWKHGATAPDQWIPPPGYFSNIYSKEDIEWENKLAVDSVQELDTDFDSP